VGLDVHAASVQVALLLPGKESTLDWRVANEERAIQGLIRKLRKKCPGELKACYEAGPTGYALQRTLESAGLPCQVIAPSLIPKKPGERIKTDRRDARKLAQLLRAGLLTEVKPPTAEQESVRGLCRARGAMKRDLTRSRHRLSKFLLLRGIRWEVGKRAWTQAHRKWLKRLRFEDAVDQYVFSDLLLGVEQIEERLASVNVLLERQAQEEALREPVGWLRCLRGVDTVTAMTLVTELHGFERFRSPRQLMSYLGLTPSESSSGESKHRGAITKTGNAHVRRILVEAAWHARHRPAVGAELRQRRKGQPSWVIALADKAQQRLHRRYQSLLHRGKEIGKIIVAIARELVGFVWAVLQGEPAAHATN
jgi:transposase